MNLWDKQPTMREKGCPEGSRPAARRDQILRMGDLVSETTTEIIVTGKISKETFRWRRTLSGEWYTMDPP